MTNHSEKSLLTRQRWGRNPAPNISKTCWATHHPRWNSSRPSTAGARKSQHPLPAIQDRTSLSSHLVPPSATTRVRPACRVRRNDSRKSRNHHCTLLGRQGRQMGMGMSAVAIRSIMTVAMGMRLAVESQMLFRCLRCHMARREVRLLRLEMRRRHPRERRSCHHLRQGI